MKCVFFSMGKLMMTFNSHLLRKQSNSQTKLLQYFPHPLSQEGQKLYPSVHLCGSVHINMHANPTFMCLKKLHALSFSLLVSSSPSTSTTRTLTSAAPTCLGLGEGEATCSGPDLDKILRRGEHREGTVRRRPESDDN